MKLPFPPRAGGGAVFISEVSLELDRVKENIVQQTKRTNVQIHPTTLVATTPLSIGEEEDGSKRI